MSEATIIYPHQLFKESPAVLSGRRIYLVEEPLLLTHNPAHRARLLLMKLALDAYERDLRNNGFDVVRLTVHEHRNTSDVFVRLQKDGVTQMHVCDTTDDYLEEAITQSGIERVWYESPLFLLTKDNAMKRYCESKRFMASFYKQLRKDQNILIDADDKPLGGQWSFDEDNRQKLPKNIELPEDIHIYGNGETDDAMAWVESLTALGAELYGEANAWLPYTPAGAEECLEAFLRARFANFGPYEDAISTRGPRLFHSSLSPLLNIGLLTPQQVLDATLTYAKECEVPLNSLEGFVRQILGWREFMRASYEVDGRIMRASNFFQHQRILPERFWDAATNIPPVDHVISTALQYGYTHHTERLMVLGNFMLLSQIHPTEVYRWFMGMYLDAYDWVMVPNVYGMSQFADGGSFATKPYISGANYLKKMSDFPGGNWEDIWTALYWHFIETHIEFFKGNRRLSMMPRMLEKMDEAKRAHYAQITENYFNSLQ